MTTNPLAKLFGKNPFNSLQSHMQVVMECVENMPALFEAVADEDRERVEAIKERIFEAEERADEIKNQLREHLPRSLFLPVGRRDLLEVLDVQDSIADVAQDIAGLLVERAMTIPAFMAEPLSALVEECVDVCRHASRIIDQLDELREMGFRGREASDVEEMIVTLNQREDVTDRLGMELARLLFQHEDAMNPVSVIFWYRLIEWVGDLADYAEKVGNRLRLLIAQ